MSLLYKDFELLKKQAAANNKNGVVGNNGTKIPMIPNVNDNKPNNVNSIFIIFILHYVASMFIYFLQESLIRLYRTLLNHWLLNH